MRGLLLCIALTLVSVIPARAAEVLIVQSSRNSAYGEALKGFKEAFRGSSRTLVLTDYAQVDLPRLVKEERPQLVLAVGDAALAASRSLRQVPVVSLMALSASLQQAPAGAFSGVGVVVAPERYLRVFKALGSKRVGVIYDPAKTGRYLQRAQEAAGQLGVELVTRQVQSAKETIARLEQLDGKVDALWMLPDTTAVTAGTVEAWFLFSLRRGVPVVTFAGHYLDKGAVAALEADRGDMGRQAAELAGRLLGADPPEATVADARRARLSTNPAVARTLGLALSALDRYVAEPDRL